jgi:hypothetical protein
LVVSPSLLKSQMALTSPLKPFEAYSVSKH